MHVKLAESNGYQEFDLAERLNRQRADIESRMTASGAAISSIDATTSQHALTVAFGFDGDLKQLAIIENSLAFLYTLRQDFRSAEELDRQALARAEAVSARPARYRASAQRTAIGPLRSS